MALSPKQKNGLRDLLRKKLDEKLNDYARETASMPFLTRLIQDTEKVAAYSFIHSISTTLGMSIYEDASEIIASENAEKVDTKVKLGGTISPGQKGVISEIVNGLRDRSKVPNKDEEISEILKADTSGGKYQKKDEIVDFYMKRRGEEYYFEIKTAKPNIDVFTATKIKLLEWVARKRKKIHTILAIPYNPYHPEPYIRFTEQNLFDRDKEFLVGNEYWDFLGGEETYKEVLNIFDEIGKEYKQKIQAKIKEVEKKI